MAMIGRLVSALMVLLGMALATASAQPVDSGHARVELVSDRVVAIPGETIWLGLSFEMDPKWHIYWENAGDAGIPPSIRWNERLGVPAEAIGGFSWPVPELLPILPGEIMDYGYSNTVVLPFPVTIPDGARGRIAFDGTAEFLICEDICVPEKAALNLTVQIGQAQVPDQRGADMINAAMMRLPDAFDGEASLSQRGETLVLSVTGEQVAGLKGEVRFFPRTHDIVHAADQPVMRGPSGLQLALTPAKPDGDVPPSLSGILVVGETALDLTSRAGPVLDGTSGLGTVNLPLLLVLALLGGLILNLMPCVLPVLSIKAMGVVASAANDTAGEARRHGLLYTAGVLASFALLAGIVVSVRAATGIATWGFWMQDPVVMTLLVLLIFLIGLWLLGLFELGHSMQNVGDGLARQQGNAGAFFTGVLAVIVGAPCTGPFLGAALGGIMSQPAPQVFAVMLTMGLGLALPFLLLSFVPGLQKKMPKPGAWMETLKQVFAFPMFLTAAYFLWTLGDLAGTIAVASTVAGAAALSFGIWALNKDGQQGRAIVMVLLGLLAIVPIFGLMSARNSAEVGTGLAWSGLLVVLLIGAAKGRREHLQMVVRGLAIAAIVAGLVWPVVQARASQGGPVGAMSYASDYPTEAWSPERVAALLAEGRPVFVDFTATWCVNCQANKRSTLETAAVADAFRRANVAFLVADYTRPDPVIAAELQRRGRAGVPMYLWYDGKSDEPVVLPEILSVSLVTGLMERPGEG